MADEEQSLETFLNKATNPSRKDEDWEAIMAFCDQVNKELEGPQISVRLIAHKIQSPQAREAMFALTTVEACVKNCGKRFHQEIGKFRFLNEIIKVVSPKYLGSYTSEGVKKKCIELMYSWSESLQHEPKIREAYTMLKTQGIVKEDPTYIDQTFEPPIEVEPREKNSIFDDEDKSKQLARLLKSKNPEDLQAANRLIKNMVKQDMERLEKQSKRTHELETVNNNVKLLTEMLQHYSPGTATESDQEILKELYESLEKRRPNLFRLASDADEKDNEAITDILQTNDAVVRVMNAYQKQVEGKTDGELLLDTGTGGQSEPAAAGNSSILLDCGLASQDPPSGGDPLLLDGAFSNGVSLLDDPLASLGSTSGQQASGKSDMDELGDIFGATNKPATAHERLKADLGLLDLNNHSLPAPAVRPPPTQISSNTPAFPGLASLPTTNTQTPAFTSLSTQPTTQQAPTLLPHTQQQQAPSSLPDSLLAPATNSMYSAFTSGEEGQGDLVTGILAPTQMNKGITSVSPSVPLTATSTSNQASITANNTTPKRGSGGMKELDALGQDLLKQSLGDTPSQALTSQPAKLPLNQIAASQLTQSSTPVMGSPAKTLQVEPLTNIHVALESIQPGKDLPVTAYDQNQLKVVIHVGKERPRPDVAVMVVSTMSSNPNPVKKFQFQAAVPKTMRVKLQTPSATDLPAFNPILPAAAITQIMLVANPSKENIKLKFKVTYIIDDKNFSDVGDVENFPVR